MSCNCRKEVEEKLTEQFMTNLPNGTGHKVTLQGYAFTFGEGRTGYRPYMEFETFALVPLKFGGSKPKKTKGNMFFSFCPFCGTKEGGAE